MVDGRSFADAVRPFADPLAAERARLSRLPLCEYHMISGACPDKRCRAVHGEYCDACNKFILHPHNPDLVKQHRKDCLKQQQQVSFSFIDVVVTSMINCYYSFLYFFIDVFIDKSGDGAKRKPVLL